MRAAIAAGPSRVPRFRGLFTPPQWRNDRRELDVGRPGAELVELSRVQEHYAALAAGKELSLVPTAVLSQYTDTVIALECSDAAAPCAARYGNGRGHPGIVVIATVRCPFRSIRRRTLDGRNVPFTSPTLSAMPRRTQAASIFILSCQASPDPPRCRESAPVLKAARCERPRSAALHP